MHCSPFQACRSQYPFSQDGAVAIHRCQHIYRQRLETLPDQNGSYSIACRRILPSYAPSNSFHTADLSIYNTPNHKKIAWGCVASSYAPCNWSMHGNLPNRFLTDLMKYPPAINLYLLVQWIHCLFAFYAFNYDTFWFLTSKPLVFLSRHNR